MRSGWRTRDNFTGLTVLQSWDGLSTWDGQLFSTELRTYKFLMLMYVRNHTWRGFSRRFVVLQLVCLRFWPSLELLFLRDRFGGVRRSRFEIVRFGPRDGSCGVPDSIRMMEIKILITQVPCDRLRGTVVACSLDSSGVSTEKFIEKSTNSPTSRLPDVRFLICRTAHGGKGT